MEYEIKMGWVFMFFILLNIYYKIKSLYWNNLFFFESKIMYFEKDYLIIINNNG